MLAAQVYERRYDMDGEQNGSLEATQGARDGLANIPENVCYLDGLLASSSIIVSATSLDGMLLMA